MRRGALKVIVLLVGLATGAAWANERLPPIGKRTYSVDRSQPYAPVKIEKDGKAQGKVMRDPIHPGGEIKVEVVRPAPKQVAAAPKSKPGKLRFKKLPVSGQLLKPRVEFSRDLLPVDRADEPVTGEFFQKVFDPAKDDAF